MDQCKLENIFSFVSSSCYSEGPSRQQHWYGNECTRSQTVHASGYHGPSGSQEFGP